MARDDEDFEVDGRTQARWAVRIFVVTAFALTLWLAGPRAIEVLAARYQQVAEQSPAVDLDKVGFVAQPPWLDGQLLLAVSADLGPWLQDRIAILDEVRAGQLREDLATSPWVRHVAMTREFPDRFRLELELRRPVLAVQAADGELLCLVDREAVALPPVVTRLPAVRLFVEGGSPTMRVAIGKRVHELRVLAAVGVAVEWRDVLAPLVEGCPELLEVDTTNLGERWMRGRSYPEIRVKLARSDGEPVIFSYGRPIDSQFPRVDVRTKASVLGAILEAKPGLAGLVAGDLRLVNRWAAYLQPRGPDTPDPDGPWSDLEKLFEPPSGR